MNSSEQEWRKAIKDCNARVYNYDSLHNLIKSKPNKFQVYFAMQTKRGIEHFTSFITTIRGEEYKVYRFLSRARINRIITRTKYRKKM